MKNFRLTILLMFFTTIGLYAQNIVKGTIIDDSGKGLQGIFIGLGKSEISTLSNDDGSFELSNLPDGKHLIIIKNVKYETQNFPVIMEGKVVNLGQVILYANENNTDQDLSTIVISDDELSDDTSAADNISGLLQSSKDVYSRTAAFEWSSSFYRIRGLDSENGKVLINGIEMNKIYNGRPQWSNWGGLNTVLRNQEFSNGLSPSSYAFGGVLGTTNISTKASEYRKGGNVSYASSNRSYVHRFMASYASGSLGNGWSFVFAGSGRMSNEGYVEGTSYNAYSMFGTVEKRINEKHSIGFTSIYASNKRGKNGPNTQEVFDIKGTQYNSYWGTQEGKNRNSRMKRIEEPIYTLSHYWDISDKISLNTNVAYQFGELGNSRIDYNGHRLLADGSIVGGGSNPDPTYYQKLPSFAVRNGNNNAYELFKQFKNKGQIDWNDLYAQNMSGFGNSKYVLYEDRSDDKQFTANTILYTEITDNITLNGRLKYAHLESENFGEVLDLLGGEYYLDIDAYGENFDQKQNDLLHPNRKVVVGDKLKYDYLLNSEIINGFVQGQFKYNKVDFYLAGDISRTTHQRDGLFQNGSFKENSFGKSEKKEFTNFGAKAGATYKVTGRHLLDFNGGYITKAPTLRNLFSRESNIIVDDLKSEKMLSFDASYILRTPIVQGKFTGYYTQIKDAMDVSFAYADGIGGDNAEFIQSYVTGIEKIHMGAELGIQAQITPRIKLKGAANFGQYTYNNNPNIALVSDNPDFNFGKRKVYLKDYKVAAGPQKAYSVGFEYRDPEYWWFSLTGNFLDEAYVDVSELKRTNNFMLDSDGLPFSDYDEVTAKKLLAQEKFDNYFTLNLVGGKSWMLPNRHYIGIFASVSNILDKKYKTGGFEQSRTANYKELKADQDLEKPVFGNKYWYGRGATYFVNVSYRF